MIQQFSFKVETFEKQITERFRNESQRMQTQVDQKLSAIDVLENSIKDINLKHRRFVDYLDEIFTKFENSLKQL